MNIILHAKNITITEAMKGYIEDKIGRVGKVLDREKVNVYVNLSTFKHKHCIEVTIPIGERTIRAEELTDDMYKSIDLVEDKLKRKIRKVKTKVLREVRKHEPISSPVMEEEEEDQVVRIKRFDIKPMSTDEAIQQMNLLDHNFFVYLNADTEEMNVVYKRHKGDYGLIESSAISGF
ncbi:ribosome hibernation-promoting factor, HPF/YfiA family [Bacillus mesophilus]|uniref:Ribosome hibernation promoting factor n=1 Tax=Bacillus mesophilus TaxID=1808955 RepID=A0A6M0Q4N9_9BACI|nr:ribosome-associated translation inhibitor RaiA [Bacillus mesophilus]NEY70759.1 ribosome-associated translation inhibitor RaiA [Bacillus mesophilus]